jgi:predicted DNA-binding transcriptional regulator AlpA
MTTDMGRQVDLDNREQVFAFLAEHVLNARKVAELTGLSKNSVYVYTGRVGLDFPEAIPEISSDRCKLWWRQDILDWLESRRT